MTKDIHTLNESFGSEIAASINEFRSRQDQVKRKLDSEYERDVPSYADAQTRRTLIALAREAEEKVLKDHAKEKALSVLERYPDEVANRREKIRTELINLADASPEMLLRVSTASDEDLEEFTGAALTSGSKKLAGIAFVEAVRRDNPALRAHIAEEMGDVFSEWENTPTEDEVEARVANQRNIVDQQLG
jgi:hypothetical protein